MTVRPPPASSFSIDEGEQTVGGISPFGPKGRNVVLDKTFGSPTINEIHDVELPSRVGEQPGQVAYAPYISQAYDLSLEDHRPVIAFAPEDILSISVRTAAIVPETRQNLLSGANASQIA